MQENIQKNQKNDLQNLASTNLSGPCSAKSFLPNSLNSPINQALVALSEPRNVLHSFILFHVQLETKVVSDGLKYVLLLLLILRVHSPQKFLHEHLS